jgi:hypothetical protein
MKSLITKSKSVKLNNKNSKKLKYKSQKNYKNKKSKLSYNKKYKRENNKIKTSWDPNIISPVFFGYPLK